MIHVAAIVVAAGSGLRFNSQIHKPLAKINSQPLILSCLSLLNRHPLIKSIVVVVNAQKAKQVIAALKHAHLKKISAVVTGGRRRQDSVLEGLKASDPQADLVLIHDAVRPFISREMLSRVIREARRHGAAILGVPVKATIKKVKGQRSKVKGKYLVEKTLERKNLWEAQTPQVFRRELILRAYKKFGHLDVTDDAMLVEKLGSKVRMVLGSYGNIKITTPEDLIIAQALMLNNKINRVSLRGGRRPTKQSRRLRGWKPKQSKI